MEPGASWHAHLQRVLAPFAEPAVNELFLNGAGAAFAEAGGVLHPVASPFADDDELCEWLLDLADAQGVRLDPEIGAAGGELPALPGRWHAVLPPMAADGPLVAVRRHRFDELGVGRFCWAPGMRQLAETAWAAGHPMLIAGPTGCGKTSLLAAWLRAYAHGERVAVLETIPELPRLEPTWVRMVERAPRLGGKGGVSMPRLLAEALRLRPDRLVIGELRGSEASSFCAAARTGHRGLMATLHAGDARDAVRRLAGLAAIDVAEAPDDLVVVSLARGRPPTVVEVVYWRET